MQNRLSRRQFLQRSAVMGGTLCLTPWNASAARTPKLSPNQKLNIGLVGVTGQGMLHLETCLRENIVAFCDIDQKALARTQVHLPRATAYSDFRSMLERGSLDGIVIATPDHTHAVIASYAMQSGCHVYCADPMSKTISEARIMAKLARRKKRVTQMGGTFCAESQEQAVMEWIQAGHLGDIEEVHAWTQKSHGELGSLRNSTQPPQDIDYDLWLGPAFRKPYRADYLPGRWRHWWHFGGGTLSDIGACYFSLAHRILGVETPHLVQAWGPPTHLENTPAWLIALYQYPRKAPEQPASLTWYHGGPRPQHHREPLIQRTPDGILVAGSKSKLLITPNEAWSLTRNNAPQRITPAATNSPTESRLCEWLEACRTGQPTTMPFEKAAQVTETLLLGNIAYRTDRKILWDSRRMESPNLPEASEYVQHSYRPGWWIG